MTYYDLYSCESQKLETARSILEEKFQLKFSAHNSLYGYYFMAKGIMGEKISIKRNYNPEMREYLEPEFNNIDILIYIDNASPRVATEYEEKLMKIEKVTLLNREVI